MSELTFSNLVPLTRSEDGSVRVTGSRVTLDTLVAVFKRGNSAEQVQDGFPSLSLSQISAVLAWYLKHQTEVERYIEKRQAGAGALRTSIEEEPRYKQLRETIRKRRQQLIKS